MIQNYMAQLELYASSRGITVYALYMWNSWQRQFIPEPDFKTEVPWQLVTVPRHPYLQDNFHFLYFNPRILQALSSPFPEMPQPTQGELSDLQMARMMECLSLDSLSWVILDAKRATHHLATYLQDIGPVQHVQDFGPTGIPATIFFRLVDIPGPVCNEVFRILDLLGPFCAKALKTVDLL